APPVDLFASAQRCAEIDRIGGGRRICGAITTHDFFIPAGAWNEIAGEANQQVVLEHQADAFLLAGAVPGLQAIQVIPAVGLEGILQQGRAHDETYLPLGHAGTQLVYHFLGDDVALLDINLIYTRKTATGKTSARGAKQQDTNETVQTIWHRVVTSTIESWLNGPESYPTDPALRSVERETDHG